jgi:hypothetical protein
VAAPTPRRPHPASKRDAHRGAPSIPAASFKGEKRFMFPRRIDVGDAHSDAAGWRATTRLGLLHGSFTLRRHVRSWISVEPPQWRETLCRQRVSSRLQHQPAFRCCRRSAVTRSLRCSSASAASANNRRACRHW